MNILYFYQTIYWSDWVKMDLIICRRLTLFEIDLGGGSKEGGGNRKTWQKTWWSNWGKEREIMWSVLEHPSKGHGYLYSADGISIKYSIKKLLIDIKFNFQRTFHMLLCGMNICTKLELFVMCSLFQSVSNNLADLFLYPFYETGWTS